MNTAKQSGQWGEALALKYLQRKKYKLVERNYSCRYGEIDLIVRSRTDIVFVEVKLRKSDRFAAAAEYVDRSKQSKLIKTAQFYLSLFETELQPRFDVIEIYAPEGTETKDPLIRHLEDAFS